MRLATLRRLPAADVAALLAVVALAIATRFYQLGAESLWLDEAITYERSVMPLDRLIADATSRFHNPAYFILIHYWLRLGDSEAMLRAPSALFGVLKVLGVYAAGRIALGRKAGLASALVICLNPAVLQYDQEARMYAMYSLGASIAICGVLWLVLHPDAAALPLWRKAGPVDDADADQRRSSRLAWLAVIVGNIVALYSHATGVMFQVACSVVALVFLALHPKQRVAFTINWTCVNLAILLVFALWLPSLLGQTHKMEERGFWLRYPSAGAVAAQLRVVLGFAKLGRAWLVLIAVFALLGSWALRARPFVLASLWLFTLLAPGLLLIASLHQPVFMPRLFLWSAVPFAVLVGCGLGSINQRVLYAGVLIAMLGFGLKALNDSYYKPFTKDRWRDAVQLLSEHGHERGTRILAIGGRENRLIRYYTKRSSDPIAAFRYETKPDIALKNLDKLVAAAWTVWTVQGRNFVTADRITTKLRARARRTMHESMGHELVVDRYEVHQPEPAR